MRQSRYLLAGILLGASFIALAVSASAQQLAQDLNESVSSIEVSVKDLYGREESGKVVINAVQAKWSRTVSHPHPQPWSRHQQPP